MGLLIVGAFSLNINIYDRNYYIVKNVSVLEERSVSLWSLRKAKE